MWKPSRSADYAGSDCSVYANWATNVSLGATIKCVLAAPTPLLFLLFLRLIELASGATECQNSKNSKAPGADRVMEPGDLIRSQRV